MLQARSLDFLGLPKPGGGSSEQEPHPQEERSGGEELRWAWGLSPPPTPGVGWEGHRVTCPSAGWPSLALGAWGRGVSSIRGQGEGTQPRVTG